MSSTATAIANPFPLTADQLAAYERDGFVVVPGMVPLSTVDAVRTVFAAVVERLARTWFDEGFVTDTFDDEPFETRYARLREQLPPKFPTSWRKILVSPEVHALWRTPEILGRARSIVGDEVYAHGVWNGRPREPHTSVQTIAWHQDAHYYKGWNGDDGKLLSVWMPLVPVDERHGCLQFMPGSHTRGWIERVRGTRYNGLYTVPDAVLADFEPVSVPLQPGDAVLFSDTTLHQALPNEGEYVRWSIDIRFGQPTPEVIAKTPRGYWCFSASDPSRVEDFETWAARYDYDEVGLDAEIENVQVAQVDLDALARELGTSRSELEAF